MNKIDTVLLKAALSLNQMIIEMSNKKLELKRITKIASLLSLSGYINIANFNSVKNNCINTQNIDGGWVSIVDTMWNTFFLSRFCQNELLNNITRGINFIEQNEGRSHLWGRSKRDFERIPVSGTMLWLHHSLATNERLKALENLWISEENSLTYKASYTLLAFKSNLYSPCNKRLIDSTIEWLLSNQREDGSFAPWKTHPVQSDTYCTSLGLLGLMSYKELVPYKNIKLCANWLINTQLSTGIWPYHEIDDGTGWALFALSEFKKNYE